VEATTLDDAVAMITDEGGADDALIDDLRDAVGEITEPTDDGQSDEIEETEEGEDDVEASDDDLDDVEIDDEDHVEDEAEDTNTHTVKVDGKDENWTLDQLKQSAAGQAAINKRFQENAEARKGLEQRATVLAQQEQHVLHLFKQAQQGGLQAPTAPTKELFDSDPIGYMEAKMTYDEAVGAYDQQQHGVQQMQQNQNQQQAQARDAYLQEQSEILKQRMPEIADPVKGAALKQGIMATGIEYGFSADEMAAVSDSRYVLALNDARKYRDLVAKRKIATQKGEKARPVVKAGTKKRPDGNAKIQQKAQDKLKGSGSINDALGLILNT